jgi:hypothetical protein
MKDAHSELVDTEKQVHEDINGVTPPQLREPLRRALLLSLCHKLHSLHDRHIMQFRDIERAGCVDIVAEMVGDLVGLSLNGVYEILDGVDGQGCLGDELFERLEPRLAAGHGSWMIP